MCPQNAGKVISEAQILKIFRGHAFEPRKYEPPRQSFRKLYAYGLKTRLFIYCRYESCSIAE